MKIFAVFAKVNLTKKPEWLDEFREKYDEPYIFHVTFKQPSVIEENEVFEVKNILSEIIKPTGCIKVVFNKLLTSTEDGKGSYVMIEATEASQLLSLQKEIVKKLNNFSYLKPEYAKYEREFHPHLTIGRRLNEEKFFKAMSEFKEDYLCEAEIKEIVLSVVNEDTVEESKKPENLTIYKLCE